MATTAELEARIAELEARLREMESKERPDRTISSLVDSLFPSETRGHMRAARKEQLLAVRSFIDHWIEKADSDVQPAPRRRESISVE